MRWPYYILVGAYCSFIFWMSSQTDPPTPEPLFPQFDKLEHMAAFGVLCGMVLVGMKRSGRHHALRSLVWIPVLFTIAFGLTDEFHQAFVPGRNVDPFDIVANTSGALIAQYVLLRYWYGHQSATLRAILMRPFAEATADVR